MICLSLFAGEETSYQIEIVENIVYLLCDLVDELVIWFQISWMNDVYICETAASIWHILLCYINVFFVLMLETDVGQVHGYDNRH